MNLTPASRRPYLSENNINIAVVFELEKEELLRRHRNRPDKAKTISEEIVRSCHFRRKFPEEGEFDIVIVFR